MPVSQQVLYCDALQLIGTKVVAGCQANTVFMLLRSPKLQTFSHAGLPEAIAKSVSRPKVDTLLCHASTSLVLHGGG
jgi:hypothetical protein